MDNRNGVCVVVAFKYNDIYYSVCTPVFENCGRRFLIVLRQATLAEELFPFQERFDKVFFMTYERNFWSLLILSFRLRALLRKLQSVNYLFLSNVNLFVSRLLIENIRIKKVVVVEDGLMNYLPPKKSLSDNFWKVLYMRIIGVRSNLSTDKFYGTFLLNPNSATMYFGRSMLLNLTIKHSGVDEMIAKLEGKCILVGGNYYSYNYMSLSEYNYFCNLVIEKYKIDYYLPHHVGSPLEKVCCETLDISKNKVTLEMVLPYVGDLSVYSFGSSVLFSCVALKANCKPVLVKTPIQGMEKFVTLYEQLGIEVKSV